MYGYIYLTTNLINGKKYIGQHAHEEFDTNYIGSGKMLLLAVEKYGKDNFSCEILEWCETEEQLGEAEYRHIVEHNAVEDRNYYNLVEGGNHKTITGQIFIHRPGKWGEKKIYPDELDDYIDKGWVKGKMPRNPQTVKKTAEKNTGQKRDPSVGKKISESNKGRKFTANHKDKLSERKKGRVWMTNGVEDKMINPKELNAYTSNGYHRGRSNAKGKPKPRKSSK